MQSIAVQISGRIKQPMGLVCLSYYITLLTYFTADGLTLDSYSSVMFDFFKYF